MTAIQRSEALTKRAIPHFKRLWLTVVLLVALAGICGPDATGSEEPQEVDLAGHRLLSAPYFKYATAFKESGRVDAAINPKLFSKIVGQTCDVYVVAQKTRAMWDSDPSLTDVRATCPSVPGIGGFCKEGAPPCRCDFLGEELNESTLVLAVANQLSSAAEPCYQVQGNTQCTGLGKGYDVVFDCVAQGEPDAELGPGDFIDGSGDEAGFYVVHDTTVKKLQTSSVDYCIVENCGLGNPPPPNPFGIPSGFFREKTHFPSNIAQMAPVPLVVIAHGNGHRYDWYGYLQEHLASYGYVVMSHQNDTVPGSHAAAKTMERHTDAFLAAVQGPVCPNYIHPALCGKVDPTRIVWIGHSRGGEGALIAHGNIRQGAYIPVKYTLESIRLLSSMAGPDNYGADPALRGDPQSTPFHLIYGAADDDVRGAPAHDSPFHHLERGTGLRQSVYIHGVGHAWFHDRSSPNINAICMDCCPGPPTVCCSGACCAGHCPWLYGPTENNPIDRERTHRIVKGYYVPLLKRYLEGNEPAEDYFWRPWETFRIEGTDPSNVVAFEYEDATDPERFIVDDFQSNPETDLSSSGGDVSFSVTALMEGVTRDADCTFEWDPTAIPNRCTLPCQPQFQQPFNGMTRAQPDEEHRAVVFEWPVTGTAPLYSYSYELKVVSGDLTEKKFLSFRAAQMPRHPLTQAHRGDLDLTVTLEDSNGVLASIPISAYGSGIEEPYPRKDSPRRLFPGCANFGQPTDTCLCQQNDTAPGCSCNAHYSTPGWQAEYETIRVRLVDFQNVSHDLDLSDIIKVSFLFGSGAGSSAGRLALDDIEFTSR